MKITITIEAEGEKRVTTINQDEFTPLDFYSTEFLQRYLDNRKAKDQTSGLPLGEDVPDETTPPPENVAEDNDLFAGIKKFQHTDKYIREHDAKIAARNAKGYKQKKHTSPFKEEFIENKKKIKTRGRKRKEQFEPNYFSDSTQQAFYNGKMPNLPGVQATPNKFIVQQTYFSGRLELIRMQYMKYFNDVKAENIKLGEGNWKPTLTWESWLSTRYAATEAIKRNIDID